MLAYVATDAPVETTVLQTLLKSAADHSFNRITVDGDTSTNDSCMLVATGKADIPAIAELGSAEYELLQTAVTEVMEQLARAIILDGEGATKLINIHIQNAVDFQECDAVAYTIAHSPLVKTAFFASDPNWGRILAAIGRAEIKNLAIDKIGIYLDNICIVEKGCRAESYTELAGQAVMNKEEITVTVKLGRGNIKEEILTCDFSYDYVKINAEYRT
jgi:glutamate N-acetyltransferase/amino-acid N-acetyltransferase